MQLTCPRTSPVHPRFPSCFSWGAPTREGIFLSLFAPRANVARRGRRRRGRSDSELSEKQRLHSFVERGATCMSYGVLHNVFKLHTFFEFRTRVTNPR